jgi:hypothetical protein
VEFYLPEEDGHQEISSVGYGTSCLLNSYDIIEEKLILSIIVLVK